MPYMSSMERMQARLDAEKMKLQQAKIAQQHADLAKKQMRQQREMGEEQLKLIDFENKLKAADEQRATLESALGAPAPGGGTIQMAGQDPTVFFGDTMSGMSFGGPAGAMPLETFQPPENTQWMDDIIEHAKLMSAFGEEPGGPSFQDFGPMLDKALPEIQEIYGPPRRKRMQGQLDVMNEAERREVIAKEGLTRPQKAAREKAEVGLTEAQTSQIMDQIARLKEGTELDRGLGVLSVVRDFFPPNDPMTAIALQDPEQAQMHKELRTMGLRMVRNGMNQFSGEAGSAEKTGAGGQPDILTAPATPPTKRTHFINVEAEEETIKGTDNEQIIAIQPAVSGFAEPIMMLAPQYRKVLESVRKFRSKNRTASKLTERAYFQGLLKKAQEEYLKWQEKMAKWAENQAARESKERPWWPYGPVNWIGELWGQTPTWPEIKQNIRSQSLMGRSLSPR